MRLLLLADQPDEYLWGPNVREALAGVDLILSCGDLEREYLEYLVTFCDAPLVYVPGNHDGGFLREPPEGCLCADDRLVKVNGVRILGLGGSAAYSRAGAYQYTQKEMERRALRQWLPIHRAGGFDVLLTHAAAFGLGDGTDPAHVGFTAFRDLLDRWAPPLFVHGHTHLTYDRDYPRELAYRGTRVVNAYGRYVVDLDL